MAAAALSKIPERNWGMFHLGLGFKGDANMEEREVVINGEFSRILHEFCNKIMTVIASKVEGECMTNRGRTTAHMTKMV